MIVTQFYLLCILSFISCMYHFLCTLWFLLSVCFMTEIKTNNKQINGETFVICCFLYSNSLQIQTAILMCFNFGFSLIMIAMPCECCDNKFSQFFFSISYSLSVHSGWRWWTTVFFGSMSARATSGWRRNFTYNLAMSLVRYAQRDHFRHLLVTEIYSPRAIIGMMNAKIHWIGLMIITY